MNLIITVVLHRMASLAVAGEEVAVATFHNCSYSLSETAWCYTKVDDEFYGYNSNAKFSLYNNKYLW